MATAGGIRAGRAYVELGTDDTALQKGLRAAESRVKAFGASIATIGAKVLGAGIGIVAPLLGAAKQFADAGSDLKDMATRTGVSVEALSALGFAAKQSGTDMETVELTIKRMQRALLAGSEENMQAAGTFASLGLSVEHLAKLAPEQQFEVLAKRIGAIRDPTARAGAALQVFGKTGTALLPMIQDFDQLTAQAKAFGLVWTTEEAKKADALGDSIDLLRASLGKAVAVIGGELAPVLTDLAEWLSRNSKIAADWARANGPLIISIAKIGAIVVGVGASLAAIGAVIAGIGTAFGLLASAAGVLGSIVGAASKLVAVLGVALPSLKAIGVAILALASPTNIIVIGLAGITTWFLTSTEAGNQFINALGSGFRDLAKTGIDAFKGIANALKAGDIALAGKIAFKALQLELITAKVAIIDQFGGMATDIRNVIDGITTYAAKKFVDLFATINKGLLSVSTGWKILQAMIKGGGEGEILHILFGAGKQLEGIEKAQPAAKDVLDKDLQDRIAARKKAMEDAAAAAKAELATAQNDFAGLQKKAAGEAAAAVAPAGGAGKPKVPIPEELAAIPETVQKAKIDVAGTFQAQAIAGLGAGKSVQDEQLKEQKKQTQQLEALNKKARQGALVFQ